MPRAAAVTYKMQPWGASQSAAKIM